MAINTSGTAGTSLQVKPKQDLKHGSKEMMAQTEFDMLLLDNSGSMGGGFGSMSCLDAAKAGIENLIAHSDCKLTSYGLITFSDEIRTVSAQTVRYIRITSRLIDVRPEGGTDTANGLARAIEHNPNRIILLTDGASGTPSQDLRQAETAASKGIRIDTIAIGGANDSHLQRISELTGGIFKRCNTPEDLIKHYAQLETRNYLLLEHHK